MPFGPYYGNPGTIKLLLKDIPSLLNGDFEEPLDQANDLVRPDIEGSLNAIFRQLPDPDDTNDHGGLSLLWLLGVTAALHGAFFSTNTVGEESQVGKTAMDRYHDTMTQIKKGTMVVPGAVRSGSQPVERAYTNQRLVMADTPNEPRDIASLFKRLLRV